MKTANFLSFLFAFLFASSLFSQSNIQQSLSVNGDGAAAHASAQLDVSATDKGMLVPRMTTAQRTSITSPATGLLVFDTTTGGFWFYNGAAWVNLSTPKTLADADNDTKIQVEETADEDIIRFDLNGVENMVLRKNAGGYPRLEFPNALDNTFIGLNAGSANTTGGVNTALGMQALFNNTDGTANTATGWWTLFSNTTGIQNTANGATALYFNSTGIQNTGVGREALFNNSTGSGNTALGRRALRFNTLGSNNTAVGHDADVLSNNLTNATAIGYNAKVNCSRCLVLGGTGTDSVNVGIGTSNPTSLLHVNGAGFGLSHTSGPIDLATYVDTSYLPLGGWFGTFSNHPLFFYTSNSATPQMALVQSGSVGIGIDAPAASALLDLTATDRGMLVPRMTSAQRTSISSPATGLLVYDTDTNAFWYYNGTTWTKISPQTVLADADNDTKIQVEETADEDIIRFDLAGTESMVLRKGAGGSTRLEVIDALDNTFVGENAGVNNTTGSSNTATGKTALFSNTTGNHNTATGNAALFSNTTGANNTANGDGALFFNTTGNSNTATGDGALSSNTMGNANTANGYFALNSNTTGLSNTANGAEALLFNTTGNNNTANGNNALHSNTTGLGNTATGNNALFSNTTGSSNTANGAASLDSNTTGSDNTANGVTALVSNTTGTGNTANGYHALSTNTTGNYNTALGTDADVSAGNLDNTTVLGSSATVNASNKVRIGNGSVTVIEGQVDWTFPSDARFKFNVQDDDLPGLAFIEKLRPVTYQFDTRKFDQHLMQNMPDSIRQQRLARQDYSKSTAAVQTGFLAQEVEQVCKKLGYEFSGLHTPESEVDNYGLAYGSFVPLLVKAVQEQQAEIEALKIENERLKKVEAQIDDLSRELRKITAALAGAGNAIEK